MDIMDALMYHPYHITILFLYFPQFKMSCIH